MLNVQDESIRLNDQGLPATPGEIAEQNTRLAELDQERVAAQSLYDQAELGKHTTTAINKVFSYNNDTLNAILQSNGYTNPYKPEHLSEINSNLTVVNSALLHLKKTEPLLAKELEMAVFNSLESQTL